VKAGRQQSHVQWDLSAFAPAWFPLVRGMNLLIRQEGVRVGPTVTPATASCRRPPLIGDGSTSAAEGRELPTYSKTDPSTGWCPSLTGEAY
jgi:hypothetical protein